MSVRHVVAGAIAGLVLLGLTAPAHASKPEQTAGKLCVALQGPDGPMGYCVYPESVLPTR